MRSLNVLLWRNWEPLYDYPATFSSLAEHSIGGTCSQLLWHARGLFSLGHNVQVLGTTKIDVVQEGIEFLGSSNRAQQEGLITSGRVREPDVIFLEGAFSAAEFFKAKYPSATVVHVGQNIDRNGHRAAFAVEPWVDIYAFVGVGQMADYSVRFPRLRHKFLLLRNVVPWDSLYSGISASVVEDHIAWVGAWTKKGLRQWAEVMERFLAENINYRWSLYGPTHRSDSGGIPKYILAGLNFPKTRISIKNLALGSLFRELGSARLILVSLGNECGPISILDAHAAGRPVISGNDMVYKYSNPEGTGIRVTTHGECYAAISRLTTNPQLCDDMGAAGKQFVLEHYTEGNQVSDIQQILSYSTIRQTHGTASHFSPNGSLAESFVEIRDKLKRKVFSIIPADPL